MNTPVCNNQCERTPETVLMHHAKECSIWRHPVVAAPASRRADVRPRIIGGDTGRRAARADTQDTRHRLLYGSLGVWSIIAAATVGALGMWLFIAITQ